MKGIPEKVTPAETAQQNRRLWEQKGGDFYSNGIPAGYPPGYPTGPTGVQSARPAVDEESVKLSTDVEPEDER